MSTHMWHAYVIAKQQCVKSGLAQLSLTEAFTRSPADRERVTVIRAEGPVFCAVLDLW